MPSTTTVPVNIAAPTGRTEADAIIQAAQAATSGVRVSPGDMFAFRDRDGRPHLVDLGTDDYLRRHEEPPVRRTGTYHLTEHGSFSTLVQSQMDAHATTLWGDRDAGRITAVLNDHASDDGSHTAGWRDHRAVLQLRHTEGWQAWTGFAGTWHDQEIFAGFLEDRAPEVDNPSGAELLEVATSIHATTGAAMKSAIRLDNGEVQVTYEETIDARAGRAGKLTIPTRIQLALAPFEGVAPYRVDARFRYRVANGALKLSVILDRPSDVLRAAFGAITEEVEGAVGLPVLMGTPAP